MSCTRERVFSGLAEQITALLNAEYGDGHECSRDLNEQAEQTQPEACPRVWLWEGPSRMTEDEYETRIVRCRLLGLVRRNAANVSAGTGGEQPLIQTLLNELERVLDAVYFLDTANGVKVNVRHDGEHDLSAGGEDGWIEMPVEVEFAREG
jgi:hypothetical protein